MEEPKDVFEMLVIFRIWLLRAALMAGIILH